MPATNGNIWISSYDTSWVILVQQRDIRVCYETWKDQLTDMRLEPAKTEGHQHLHGGVQHRKNGSGPT